MENKDVHDYLWDLDIMYKDNSSNIYKYISAYLEDWHTSKWHVCPDRIDQSANIQPYVPCTCSRFDNVRQMVGTQLDYSKDMIRFLISIIGKLALETDKEYALIVIKDFEKSFFGGKENVMSDAGKEAIEDVKRHRLLKNWGKQNTKYRKEVDIGDNHIEDFLNMDAFFKKLKVKKDYDNYYKED